MLQAQTKQPRRGTRSRYERSKQTSDAELIIFVMAEAREEISLAKGDASLAALFLIITNPLKLFIVLEVIIFIRLLVLDLLVGSSTTRGAVAGNFGFDVGEKVISFLVVVAVRSGLQLELLFFVLVTVTLLALFAVLARGWSSASTCGSGSSSSSFARGASDASTSSFIDGTLGSVRVTLAELLEDFLAPVLVCVK